MGFIGQKTDKMKKWIIILAAVAMTLSGCRKESLGVNRKDWLVGTWYENYDPRVFAFDGSSEITFYENGTAQWTTSSIFGGKPKTIEYLYTYEKNILTVVFDGNADVYEVIFLNKDEMAWQRYGTTYSPGTWASDYLHFNRSKD